MLAPPVVAPARASGPGLSMQGFRLGGAARQSGPKMNIQDDDTPIVNRALLAVDHTKNLEVSDYLNERAAGFKSLRSRAETTGMDTDEKPAVYTRRERNLHVTFVDDDDLQAASTRSRMSNVRKVAKLSPEELGQRVAEEKAEAEEEAGLATRNEQAKSSGGLELDDTCKFVRSVTFDPVAEAEPKELALQPPTTAPAPAMRDETVGEMEIDDKEDGEVDAKGFRAEIIFGQTTSSVHRHPIYT